MTRNFLQYGLLSLLMLAGFSSCSVDRDVRFLLHEDEQAITVYVDPAADGLVEWAAGELADGIGQILGREVSVSSADSVDTAGKGIYIGTVGDAISSRFSTVSSDELVDSWEHFSVNMEEESLIITGSDVRGTVYGVFDVAEKMGISPWIWWADSRPAKQARISLSIPQAGIVQGPSVQYRGIFLNDEDWGLQPWAAQTFEPETGDIGPKTYEKIFQLLLRLKANTIWPAMHPCTQAFFSIPGNREMAERYHIFVGTSHAEPMLRNNVDEWDHDAYGDFNYFTNSETVREYWKSRIEEVKDGNVVVTVGMRGIHDSGMQGDFSTDEKVKMLEQIISDQRDMLANTMGQPAEDIPQVFIPYKEVLALYDAGMEVPEDITLMWTDDNYGYIRRLSSEAEQQRSGGSGVYYHLSYWGRPHDYLWLSSTQPGLMWLEMTKSYQNGAKNIWIANVGDIKPAEYNLEFFLDLAWDVNSIQATTISRHLTDWCNREFGEEHGPAIAAVKDEYYRLAFLRKPEYMGWSRTEPTTPTFPSGFTFANGNERQRRIDSYEALAERVEQLSCKIPEDKQDAWFQLIAYPVRCASLMNQKFLYAQQASLAADMAVREQLLQQSRDAYQAIIQLTDKYNQEVAGGKWNRMMSMRPRHLPVFDLPDFQPADSAESSAVQQEGGAVPLSEPVFVQAAEMTNSSAPEGFEWKVVEGLGYSHASVTLFPFVSRTFQNEFPVVEYQVEVPEAGRYDLEIRCLPTHANNFDQKIWVEWAGVQSDTVLLSTVGRSEAWKANVLRNYAPARFSIEAEKPGKHTLRVFVNQTGVVIDQLSLTPEGYPAYYEVIAQ